MENMDVLKINGDDIVNIYVHTKVIFRDKMLPEMMSWICLRMQSYC